jgi:PAS domain S-box-containing protein
MAQKPTYEELEKRIKKLERESIKQKQTVELLTKEGSRYRTLFNATRNSLFIVKDYQFVECNKVAMKKFGCENEKEILGFSLWDFSPPTQPDGSSSKEKAIKMIDAALGGKPMLFYWKLIQKDGREFDAEVSLSHLESEGANSLQAIVKDITELTRAWEELRENEEKYRTLFDMESDAVALIEIETGDMLDVNKAFVELYGYSKEEVLRMKNTDFSAEPEVTKEATRAHLKYVPVRYHKKRDGSVFPTEITASIFKYQGRDVHIAAIRDITERKRLESQLQRSQKMKSLGLLAGGVAHDLNNILAGIVNYPELILLDLPEDSKLRKPIKNIKESGHRAVAIVQDMLTVARGVATTKAPLNLNDLISDYLNSPEYKKLKQFHPEVSIRTILDPELFSIKGSDVHIRKVVMNLVSNASEAIEVSGNVTISTENRYVDKPLKGYDDVTIGEYAVLAVSDNGSGISSDELERIFDPFYTKKVLGRSGTGLGLTVIWNVVQDLDGYIDVKSDENGTTFELYFPITREEISEEALTIPMQDYTGNGETILVVDDVKSQREITGKMLTILGYKATAVSCGEKAVEYLTEHAVDLIVLDMIMDPNINGYETYKRIIKIHPKQKAIIVSGFAETEEVRDAQKSGAGPYIKKPFTLEKIGIAIRDELKK